MFQELVLRLTLALATTESAFFDFERIVELDATLTPEDLKNLHVRRIHEIIDGDEAKFAFVRLRWEPERIRTISGKIEVVFVPHFYTYEKGSKEPWAVEATIQRRSIRAPILSDEQSQSLPFIDWPSLKQRKEAEHILFCRANYKAMSTSTVNEFATLAGYVLGHRAARGQSITAKGCNVSR